MLSQLAFIQNIGPLQLVIILALGLLIFGRRLPEIGRSLGKSIVEFKKGIAGIQDEIDEASRQESSKQISDKKESSVETAEGEHAEAADPRRVSRSDSVEGTAH